MMSNYYPFGMAQTGRNWDGSNGNYRYGYNGKEEDNEIKTNSGDNGKSLDYGARWYDPRKARWDAVDKYEAKYVGISPYVFTGNNPILNKEIDGNFYYTYHIALEIKAIAKAYGHLKIEAVLEKMKSTILNTMWRETYGGFKLDLGLFSIGGYDPILHLDNIDNPTMVRMLDDGDYDRWDNHQLADFYSHSNYVDIMLANGYEENNIPTFDELDKNSDIYKKVIGQIRTTDYSEKKDLANPYDHDNGYTHVGKEPSLLIQPFGAKDKPFEDNEKLNKKFDAAYNTAQKALNNYYEKEARSDEGEKKPE